MTAGEVEHRHARLAVEQPSDQVGIGVAALIGQHARVETPTANTHEIRKPLAESPLFRYAC
jgi:hypothetical protein